MKLLNNCILVFLICLSVPSLAQFGDKNTIMNNDGYFGPETIISIDLDNDGIIDIVSSNYGGKIVMFKGLGDGDFGVELILMDLEYILSELAVEDIDGDGLLDLIVGSSEENRLMLFLNIGETTFGEEIVLSESTNNIEDIAISDIDYDGDLDVVSASYDDDKIAWYSNEGGGVFSEEIIITFAANGTRDINIADIDNDGYVDIISANDIGENLIWYKNDGSGDFISESVIVEDLEGPRSVLPFDFDGDGDIDIVSASYYYLDSKVVFYENLGGAVFAEELVLVDTLSFIQGMVGKDLDSDGDFDIIATSSSTQLPFWFENMGDNVFEIHVIPTPTPSTSSVIVEDLDGDGFLDLGFSLRTMHRLSWMRNDGFENFLNYKLINESITRPWTVEAMDLDNDGYQDLITGSLTDHRISWFRNLGNSTFDTQSLLLDGDISPSHIIATDLDDDGYDDLLFSLFNQETVAWMKNLGDASMGPVQVLVDGDFLAPSSVKAADLDNDGDLDVLCSSQYDDKLAWFENFGGGTFGPINNISTIADGPVHIEAADVNGDGRLDVLAACSDGNMFVWHQNMGDGSFGGQNIIGSGCSIAYQIQPTDVDYDGDLDAVCVGKWGLARWYENDGAGEVWIEHSISTLGNGISMILKDIDGDLDLDIIKASAGAVQWGEREPDYFLYPQKIYSEGEDFQQLIAVDIDNDNDLDLVTVSDDENELAWFENHSETVRRGSGTTFVDIDDNGLLGDEDIQSPVSDVSATPSGDFNYMNPLGNYVIQLDTTLDVSYSLGYEPSELWTLSSPFDTYALTVDSDFTNQDSLNFGFIPNVLVDSLSCNLIGAFPRCNTEVSYWINYKNLGSTNPVGKIQLILSEPIEYYSCEITPTEIIGDTIRWEYETLDYFEERTFFLRVTMPTVDFLDYPLISHLSVSVDSLEDEVFQTADTLEQLLACAYDPNDKTASPSGFDSLGYIFDTTEQLEYTIRFQNTGTDTALNIKIKDQLDSSLDWNSFDFITSSHDVIVDFFPTGEVVFKFNDIFLPDSGTNEPLSQGFLKYRINILDTIDAGTSIYNYADIYFDENAPIKTNTEISTLYNCETLGNAIQVNSEVCTNDSVFGNILFLPPGGGITWNIDDDEFYTRQFSWSRDTSGIFPLNLVLNTEVCYLDTTLFIQIHPTYIDTLVNLEICYGDSISIFGEVVIEEGIYTDSLTSIFGCDSLLLQELIVNALPTAHFNIGVDSIVCIEQLTIPLSAEPSGGVFSGVGVEGTEFYPFEAGLGEHELIYAYTDMNSCISTDTLLVVVVECLGISTENNNKISIHPNPFNEFTIIDFGEELIGENQLIIHDGLGKEIYRIENLHLRKFVLSKEELGTGMYILTLIGNNEQVYTSKLIVQ